MILRAIMEGIQYQARGKAHPRNLLEWQTSCQIISVEIIECFSSLPLWSTPSTSVSILGPVLLEFEGVSDWAWPTLTSSTQIVILCAIIEGFSYQARATHDTVGIYQNDNASIKLLVPKSLKVPYLYDVLHQHGNPSFALVLLLWISEFQYKFNWRSSKMLLRLSNCIQFDWNWRTQRLRMTYFDIICTRLWFSVKLLKEFHALDIQSANATKLIVSESLNVPVPIFMRFCSINTRDHSCVFLNFQYIVQVMRTMLSGMLKIEGDISNRKWHLTSETSSSNNETVRWWFGVCNLDTRWLEYEDLSGWVLYDHLYKNMICGKQS